jgi:hypothetical protein
MAVLGYVASFAFVGREITCHLPIQLVDATPAGGVGIVIFIGSSIRHEGRARHQPVIIAMRTRCQELGSYGFCAANIAFALALAKSYLASA